jgi:hypothetical protein
MGIMERSISPAPASPQVKTAHSLPLRSTRLQMVRWSPPPLSPRRLHHLPHSCGAQLAASKASPGPVSSASPCSPRRIWQLNRRLMRTSILTLLLALSLIHHSGCGGSSSPSTSQNAGTPKGTQTITVTAADSAGGPSHSISLQLTVQ